MHTTSSRKIHAPKLRSTKRKTEEIINSLNLRKQEIQLLTPEPYFTVRTFARHMSVTMQTVRRWIKQGLIKGRFNGHSYRISQTEAEVALRLMSIDRTRKEFVVTGMLMVPVKTKIKAPTIEDALELLQSRMVQPLCGKCKTVVDNARDNKRVWCLTKGLTGKVKVGTVRCVTMGIDDQQIPEPTGNR